LYTVRLANGSRDLTDGEFNRDSFPTVVVLLRRVRVTRVACGMRYCVIIVYTTSENSTRLSVVCRVNCVRHAMVP